MPHASYTIRLDDTDNSRLLLFAGRNLVTTKKTTIAQAAAKIGLKVLTGQLTETDAAELLETCPALRAALVKQVPAKKEKAAK